jgi:hypothetical protein
VRNIDDWSVDLIELGSAELSPPVEDPEPPVAELVGRLWMLCATTFETATAPTTAAAHTASAIISLIRSLS